jgi:uncharacterized protein YpmB
MLNIIAVICVFVLLIVIAFYFLSKLNKGSMAEGQADNIASDNEQLSESDDEQRRTGQTNSQRGGNINNMQGNMNTTAAARTISTVRDRKL